MMIFKITSNDDANQVMENDMLGNEANATK